MNEKMLLSFTSLVLVLLIGIVISFVLRKRNMRKIKPKFLTVEEIQEKMRRGEPIPTAVFSAMKREYIVKARTIYAKEKKGSNGAIKY